MRHSFDQSLFHRLRSSSNALFWLGVTMVAIGLAAVVFPILSTLAAAILVGWVRVYVFGSFSIHGTGPFFGALLFSLLSIAAGAFTLFNPLAGAVALTLLLGVTFVFQGAFELFFALEMRPHPGWMGMLISGLASIVMAVLIAAGWPASAPDLATFLYHAR